MKFSLCVICRNEEDKILRCIQSVKEIIDEIIVVDTGSTDRTIELAKQEGACVYEMVWQKNFSIARNEALGKVTGDWIVFLDADEYMESSSLSYIKSMIGQCEKEHKDYILSEMLNEGENQLMSSFKTIRIFKKNSKVRYKGAIHERLHHISRELSGLDFSKQIKIIHDGYKIQTTHSEEKLERNEELLLEQLRQDDHDSETHFYLMGNYLQKQDFVKALYHAKQVLENKNNTLWGAYEYTYKCILKICLNSNIAEDITRKYYLEAIKIDDTYPDFDWHYGLYLKEKGFSNEGLKHIENCLHKINIYSGLAYTEMNVQVNKVHNLLVDMYIHDEYFDKAFNVIVKLLKSNREDYDILYRLIYIAQYKDDNDRTKEALEQIYDFELLKYKIILLKITKALNNKKIYETIFNRLSTIERTSIKNNKELYLSF